jgi:hypothetical protein
MTVNKTTESKRIRRERWETECVFLITTGVMTRLRHVRYMTCLRGSGGFV